MVPFFCLIIKQKAGWLVAGAYEPPEGRQGVSNQVERHLHLTVVSLSTVVFSIGKTANLSVFVVLKTLWEAE